MPGMILGTGDKAGKLTELLRPLRNLYPHGKRQITKKKMDRMIIGQMAINTVEKEEAGWGREAAVCSWRGSQGSSSRNRGKAERLELGGRRSPGGDGTKGHQGKTASLPQ